MYRPSFIRILYYLTILLFTSRYGFGFNLHSNNLYIHRLAKDRDSKSLLNGSYFGISLAFQRLGPNGPTRLLVGSPHDSIEQFTLPNLSGKVYSCELEQLISNTAYSNSNPLRAPATSSCSVQLSAPRNDTDVKLSSLDPNNLGSPAHAVKDILEENQQLGFSVDSFTTSDFSIAAVCGHQLGVKYNESDYQRTFSLGNCFSLPWDGRQKVPHFRKRRSNEFGHMAKYTSGLNDKERYYIDQKNVRGIGNDFAENIQRKDINKEMKRRYKRQGQETSSGNWNRVSSIWWTYENMRRGSVIKYGYAEIGTSVHVTRKGNIVMGAPGFLFWAGGVYLKKEGLGECMVTIGSEENEKSHFNYLGYSVTSSPFRTKPGGSMDDDDEIYISGAPRWNFTGQVLVFRVTERIDPHTCKIDTRQILTVPNMLMGSYFGWSVYSEDINGDGMGDLFVGAPYYHQNKGDEGAVFVYMRLSDKREQNLNQFSENYTVLLGLNVSPGAKFGSVISSAGDVNLDGFNDIVIGAPFDDGGRGSVFLYLGGANGLHQETRYVQKFTPKVLSSKIMSFGFSISSQSADIDSNAYPDLAVGAFMSELVALVRSRPVHMVTVQIDFSAPLITWPRHHCATSRYPEGMREYDVTVNFFYNIPARQMSSGATLVSYDNKYLNQVSQGQASTLTFLDIEKLSLDLSVKRCLAVQWADVREDCVSFEVTKEKGYYISRVNNEVKVMHYDSSSRNLQKEDLEGCSFISRLNQFKNGTFSFESVSKRGWYLGVGPEGHMTLLQSNQSIASNESLIFNLKLRKDFQGLKGVVYNMSVDTLLTSQGQLPSMKVIHEGRHVSHVTGVLNFDPINIFKPQKLTWRAVFTNVTRNVLLPPLDPVLFEIKLEQRINDADKSVNSPLLNVLSPNLFRKQMEFFNPCGADSICTPQVSIRLFDNLTLASSSVIKSNSSSVPALDSVSPVIVGDTKPLSLYAVIQNSGEPADQVELILKYPSELRFKQAYAVGCLEQQLKCVSRPLSRPPGTEAASGAKDVESLRELFCEFSRPLFNDSFVIVQIDFEPIDENYTPRVDSMTFNAEVISRTGLSNQTATAKSHPRPIRYDGRLILSWDVTNEYPVGYNPNTKKPVIVKHVYRVISQGQGVNPGVKVLVHIPLCPFPDLSIVESLTVTVKYMGRTISAVGEEKTVLPRTQAVINCDDNMEEDCDVTSVNDDVTDFQDFEDDSNRENAIRRRRALNYADTVTVSTFNSSLIEREAERNRSNGIYLLKCPTKNIKQYNIGSMKPNTEVVVSISVKLLTSIIIDSSWKEVHVLVESKVEASPSFLNYSHTSLPENITGDIVHKSLKTTVKPSVGAEPPSPWTIIMGVGIGLLILLIILLILYKCGFFKRKRVMMTGEEEDGEEKELGEGEDADENKVDDDGCSIETREQRSIDKSFYDLPVEGQTDQTDLVQQSI